MLPLPYHLNVNATWAVFSRQQLSHLTFLKVVCLQTSLGDFKMIPVFTGKIKCGEHVPMNKPSLVWWLKFNENSTEVCRLAYLYGRWKSNCFYAISGCHPLSDLKNR